MSVAVGVAAVTGGVLLATGTLSHGGRSGNAARGGTSSQRSTTSARTPTSTAVPTPTSRPTANAGLLAAVPRSESREEIQNLLQQYHEDIIAGDDRGAWKLLSSRKQAADRRQYGFATWAAAQNSLAPYLDPSRLRVSIRSMDPSTGVAIVRVTGMKWSKPHAKCSEWSGVTWVKYENGAWRYDPGFSTTRERRREWKRRSSQLLGASC